MKYLFLTMLLFCQIKQSSAQFLTCDWSRSGKPSNFTSTTSSTCADSFGNVYLLGYFKSYNITFGNFTLTQYGSSTWNAISNIFLIKYNSSGTIIWSKRFGECYNNLEPTTIKLDHTGNIVIGGSYQGTGAATFGAFSLQSSKSANLFVVKADTSGIPIWAKMFEGSGISSLLDLSIDMNNNITFTGYFNDSTITFGNFVIHNSLGAEMYIAKLNPSGSVLWAKGASGKGDDQGDGIVNDFSGNTYVVGNFTSDTIKFGNLFLKNTQAPLIDGFIIKYDNNGNELWAKQIKGTSNDRLYEITMIDSNNLMITGGFNSSQAILNNVTLNNNSSPGVTSLLLASYNSAGAINWARTVIGSVISENIVLAENGSCFVSGICG
jgi:hypothetical protein